MKDRFKSRYWGARSKQYLKDICKRDNGSLFNLTYKYYHMAVFRDDVIEEQCTGLKDKNGDFIFEGDRLEIRNPSGTIHKMVTVFFEKGSFMIGDIDRENTYIRTLLDEGWEYEIAGNIHGNGDLLDGR